jgi:hypothetical protein
MGLHVELPMFFEICGHGQQMECRRHMDVRYLWITRELKEQGIIRVIWTSGESTDTDLFTMNLLSNVFYQQACC